MRGQPGVVGVAWSPFSGQPGDVNAAGIVLAVGREGLETALFLWATTSAVTSEQGSVWSPLVGATLGITTAVLLGWLIYRGAISINLSRFFTWTGAFLVFVAAGVLAYGVHDLQEARFLPGLNTLAFDVSATIDPSSWYATLLKGIFNFTPRTTLLQAIAWVAYVVPVMTLFVRGARRRSAGSSAPRTSVPA